MILGPGSYHYEMFLAEWRRNWFAFILKYPNAPWMSEELSSNENVDLETVQSHPTLQWSFSALSENPNLTMSFVRRNPDWLDRWDWAGLSQLPSITIEDVDDNANDQGQFSYPWLSACPNITAKMIVERPKPDDFDLHPWNQQVVGEGYRDWDMRFLSYNQTTTYATVLEYPNFRWSFTELSRNPSITWQDVLEHWDEAWDWSGLSENPNVDWSIVRRHCKKPWNMSALSARLPVTQDIIDEFNGTIDFRYLSMNPCVTEGLITANPRRAWDWDRLSATLPLSVIAAHEPNVTGSGMWRWNWKDVSRNPHLTWSFVELNKTKPWNFHELSRNTQPVARTSFLAEKEHHFFENSPKRYLHEELLGYFPGETRRERGDPSKSAQEVLAILARKRINSDHTGGKRVREWRSFRENDGMRPRNCVRAEDRDGNGEVATDADMVLADNDGAAG